MAVFITALTMTSIAYYAQAKSYGNTANNGDIYSLGMVSSTDTQTDALTGQSDRAERTCIVDNSTATTYCGSSGEALIWAIRTDWEKDKPQPSVKQAPEALKPASKPAYVRKGHNESIMDSIRLEAQKQGYGDVELALDIADCESRYNPKATGVNKDGTRDRGVFQINEYWHKNISDECAYDAECNIRYAISLLNQGKAHLWSCYRKVR